MDNVNRNGEGDSSGGGGYLFCGRVFIARLRAPSGGGGGGAKEGRKPPGRAHSSINNPMEKREREL